MKRKHLALWLAAGVVVSGPFGPQLAVAAEREAAAVTATQWRTLTREAIAEATATAIARLEQTKLQEWAFCLASAENEEGELTSSTECFDPSLPADQQWQLRLSNGQKPTAQQQRQFLTAKQKQAKKGKSFNLTLKLSRVVVLDSVQFVREDATSWYGRFDVAIAKLGDKASKQLQGELRFNKAGHFIDRIDIRQRGPFSVMWGSEIQRFELSIAFIQLGDAILQQQQEMKMQGTFAFVTPIDEVSSDVFSDFRYIGSVGKITVGSE